MQISLNDWIKYKNKLASISEKAADEMVQWLQTKGGYQNVSRTELIDYAYALSTKYGEASASLSALMYDETAEKSGVTVPSAEVADTATYGEVAKAVNGVTKKLTTDNQVGSVVNRMVKQAGADTILKNAKRDGAQFAWVPAGDTCAFCLALAANGWQYASKEGNHADHIHPHCDCTYAVRFDDKSTVKGYDPEKYKKIFENAEGDTWEEKINSVRRMQYHEPETHKKILAQKKANYAEKKDKKDNNIIIRMDNNKYFMNYGKILNGEPQTIDAGGDNHDKVISCTRVEFENTNVFISDLIYESSKNIMDKIEPYLIEGLDAVGREHGIVPTFVIADETELTDSKGRNVRGRYLYDSNTVVLVPQLFEGSDKSDEYNAHLTFHELLHWRDCQEMGKIYPGLKEAELVPIVCKDSKKNLDKLGITKYNVKQISDYAADSLEDERYDEVLVEYRAKELMEKRNK